MPSFATGSTSLAGYKQINKLKRIKLVHPSKSNASNKMLISVKYCYTHREFCPAFISESMKCRFAQTHSPKNTQKKITSNMILIRAQSPVELETAMHKRL